MRTSHPWTAALAVATTLNAQEALAQAPRQPWYEGGIAMDRLEPTPPGDPFFSVPSPFVGGNVVLRGSLTLDYAKNPLVLSTGDVIISGQTFAHVGISLALVDRVLASIELPGVLLQSGDAPTLDFITFDLPESPIPEGGSFRPAVGDLRLGARVRVLGEEDEPFQVAVGSYIHIPSFMASSILREPGVRISPAAHLGGRYKYLVWSATVGAVLRDSETPSTITYGAGAALSFGDDRLLIGSEIFAATPIRIGVIALSEDENDRRLLPAFTSAEWLLNARLRLGPIVFGGALGFGIGEAPGTPLFRAIGSIAVSARPPALPEPPPVDTDEDGTLDPNDACPYASGPWSSNSNRSGCPTGDRDGDGVPNEEDTCPNHAGSKTNGGCAPDDDDDRVPNALDFCPEAKGAISMDGCPDEDNDGVRDSEDGCPNKKGKWHVDPKLNGCPARSAPAPDPAPTTPTETPERTKTTDVGG